MQPQFQVKKLVPHAKVPAYARPLDAGLDISASEEVTIQPNSKVIVGTGLSFAIPHNHVGLIWDRSGMAAKHSITCLAGVIDETYRGELKIVLFNLSDQPYTIAIGDRIAQLLIQPIVHVNIQEVTELQESVRGELGFGSSGK